MILRRHIGKRLAAYYAQPANQVVGTISNESVDFRQILGEWHWKRIYGRLYKEQQGQWLTPVELFRPHYSNILADFILKESEGQSGIHVVELGGGRANNARLILDRLQGTPDMYDRLASYTIVDASPTLHDFQKQALEDGQHSHKLNFHLQDLTEVAEEKVTLLTTSDEPTIVLGLELLDNLAHDKVRRSQNGKLEQAEITFDSKGQLQENFVPLTDKLLSESLKAMPTVGSTQPFWFPTVACGVLRHITKARPNSSMLLADFDWLPSPDLLGEIPQRKSKWAEGEPIVTDMEGMDHECFLNAPGIVDILYSTNFPKLAAFLRKTCGPHQHVLSTKQALFLQSYGQDEINLTKSWLSGYTPLVEDFGNCSVLTVTRQNRGMEMLPKRKSASK
jgi:SAM-dependent MidA family methyltransferase